MTSKVYLFTSEKAAFCSEKSKDKIPMQPFPKIAWLARFGKLT